MKRLVILLLGAALAACSGTSKPYVLTGRIAHAGADDLLLIGTHFNQMDTVRLAEDGSFTYSRTVGEPAFGFAYLPDRAFYALVFIDGSSSHLEADADTPTEYRVTGDLEAAQAFHLATMQQLSALAEKEYASFAQMDNAFNKLRDSLARVLESIEPKAFRAPELKIREHIVGRRSRTQVDVLYLDGIADPDTVERVRRRLDDMDIDGVEAAGNIEEYLTDHLNTPFPTMPYTQRPDRFCQAMLEGRVGLMADGLPFAWMLPGTIDQFFKTGQDRAFHWMAASALNVIRWFCAFVTILVPGLYIALVTFHPEAIPVKLALSIVAAKQEVPFSTVFEVLIMLLAFEVLQEAGLRLPSPIGATVSILGGLVVGNAAVEAHIVSPAVLIAVAIAGVAGYAMPSQDFAAALRLWRFLLAILASAAGLFGLAAGCAALIYHLAGLETFGVPYLAPFTSGAGEPRGHPSLLRPPLPRMKWRDGARHTLNRRNQR